MDHLMLLGGPFLQARIRGAHDLDPALAAARSREFWDDVDAVGRGASDAYGLAARLVVGLVVLGFVFAALGAGAPSGSGSAPTACAACSSPPAVGSQPSFTPFSAATWSESIGR